MLGLLLVLGLLLLRCQGLSLFGHLLQASLAALETLLELSLLGLLLSDHGHTEVETGAVKFLLLQTVIVLQPSFDEGEKLLVVSFHDIVYFLTQFSKLSL